MPRILSIETSTSVCSAAIHDNGKLTAVCEIHEEQSHASKLAVVIQQLFFLSGVREVALDAVAVSSGPGSYTGLRIGVSTAKGICFANNIPLLAVNSLEILAWKVVRQKNLDGLFCPLIDARRMEAYCTLYDKDMKVIEPMHSRVFDNDSFESVLRDIPINFFGDATEKISGVLRHANARYVHNIYPSAAGLGEIAFERFQAGQFEDLVHFEPVYLKEFLVKKSTKTDDVLNK